MSAEKKQPFDVAFKDAPRWQRIFFCCLFGLIVVLGPVVLWIESQDKQNRPYVQELTTLADTLAKASKTGDKAGAVALYDPVSSLLRKISADPNAKTAPTRYCLVAAMHIGRDMDKVIDHGARWDRTVFDNALDECKQ